MSKTSQGAARSWLGAVGAALASYRLCVACLLGLLLLTWLGTLYQVEHGLYAAQRAYFDSWFVLQRLGDVFVGAGKPRWLEQLPFAIPLPGGMLLMWLLAVNLLCGGFVRLVRLLMTGTRVVPRLGVLIVHCGIAILLLAGLVRFQTGIEGSVALIEGQATRSYQSFHEWELAVRRQVADGEVEEHLIPGERFLDLPSGRHATFTSARLPFMVIVEHALRNAEARPLTKHFEPARERLAADGFVLHGKPLLSEHERNVAGCLVAVRLPNGVSQRSVLVGSDVAPWTIEAAGSAWALQLRKKAYPLPFAMRLDHFEAEMYPGTRKPKAFRSDVTVIDTGGDQRRVRIQMNEPLRRGDIVVYQSTWGQQGPMANAPLFSGFQVVHNPADQWPLYGCIVLALGMLIAFGSKLFRFVAREASAKRDRGAGAATATPTATTLGATLVVLLGATSLSAQAPAKGSTSTSNPLVLRSQPYDPAAVAAFRCLPLQDDGRVKPFLTQVSYLLLRLNGKRSVRVPDQAQFGALANTTLSPTEWAMDVLLFPEQADLYPVFQVQTSEVIDAIELPHEGKRKRDRYSYDELKPGLAKLLSLGDRYARIPEKERSGVEQQVFALARNVADYQRLVSAFDPPRVVLAASKSEALKAIYGERDRIRFSDLVERWPQLAGARVELPPLSQGEPFLRWIPPSNRGERTWLGPSDLIGPHRDALSAHGGDLQPILAVLRHHERLLDTRSDPKAFAESVAALETTLQATLRGRGEGSKLEMEVGYLEADYFFRALYAFGAAFVVACFLWLRPRSRWLGYGTWIGTALGTGILIYGIVVRCILRSRPPISGLYDTILFVTSAMVLSALVVEAFHRRKVVLSLAAFLGFLGMFLAGRFEKIDGQDTLPTLQAVLDTNFWLATHVTVVNLGYAGTLLAGFLGHLFLLGRLFGQHHQHPAFFHALARATYGTVCFATLFVTVGTILGGIWANDSWGRFWGWDPKENGALMIVLWNLAILHSRMGGIVREHGLAMMAVAGNMVVVFSWFHTNLLGVGLHSYGFASGLNTAVWTFYAFEVLVLVLGMVGARMHRARTLPAT